MTEIKQAACVIITNPETKKILIISRKDNHNDFGLPGGKKEENETLAQCAVRELREETGFIVDEKDLIFVYASVRPNLVCSTFNATSYTGEISSSTEEGLVKWGDWEDITNDSSSFAVYNKNLYKRYKENNGY